MRRTTRHSRPGRPSRVGLSVVLAGLMAVPALAAAGCGSAGGSTDSAHGTVITAVGAENEYANVLGQIGGQTGLPQQSHRSGTQFP